MNEEMKALKKNKTWKYVKLQEGKKLMRCIVKYTADGLIERYKASMVVKGHTQTYETDYIDFCSY